MDASNKPVRNYVFSQATVLTLSIASLGLGSFALISSGRTGPRAAGLFLIVIGIVLLAAVVGGMRSVFRGKLVHEEVVSLSLPGKAVCDLKLPTGVNKGRLIIFFEETIERYTGRVTLSKQRPSEEGCMSVDLPRLEPFRLKIPKWLPTSDAGGVYENWPRRTGSSSEPVTVVFPFSVEAGEKLKLEFDLQSNFKDTKLERRFPITGKETVRLFVKQ